MSKHSGVNYRNVYNGFYKMLESLGDDHYTIITTWLVESPKYLPIEPHKKTVLTLSRRKDGSNDQRRQTGSQGYIEKCN